ncbi:hypothetical protein J7624_09475 [Wohlfahrtiimonas chitiniclastica]|uniref:hypothetical protein n=1 Tax=Wohlfahrtiimonas chitiniclastica TaxID=400946 RepID=UPI001BCAB0DE|nr:hypothetical protein [Wohlfahrtiimonas chitiniclastica]MBS7827371.1 hypothetical protein [Wohlfahrtiimonas chitiniclastica]
MRILLLFVLTMIILGCSQNYEEINGIKLGESIDSVQNIDEYEGSIGQSGATLYSLKDLDNINRDIGIEVLDGKIELVEFSKNIESYKYDYSNFKFFLAKAIERWGSPEVDDFKEEDGKITRFLLFRPKNNVIGEIEIFYSESKGSSYIHERYATKKFSSHYTAK